MMAFFRAVADLGGTAVRDFQDPVAAGMLSPRWSLGLAVMRRALRRPSMRARFVETAAARGLDCIPLRTRAIDAAWQACVPDCPQLVILGAGLDGRAWRLTGAKRIFEVDQPATQRYKRHRVADLPAPRVDLRWVALDLARGDLERSLQDMGFDSTRRSFWIWEGVIPYLTPPTTAAVLETIARCAAPQSRLAATYIPPQPTRHNARILGPVRQLFRRLGEPFVGLLTEEQMAGALDEAGFEVRSDTGVPDWAKRFSDGPAVVARDIGERLVVAERR